MESLTDDCKEPFHGPHKQAYAVKWEDVDGTVHDYTGLYELRIDDEGQIYVWSLARFGVCGRRLSPTDGRVVLCKDSVKIHYRLHQIWCYIVLGPPPVDGQKYTVDHIDTIHANNSPYNLRWATPSQQCANRKKYTHQIKWVPLLDSELLLERREFYHIWFLETGLQVKQTKGGVWLKGVDRKLTDGGYYMCSIGKNEVFLIQRVMAYIFGGDDGIFLDDICDDTIIIEHLDGDKTNNHKNNLRVSTHKNNSESWHASGKSTKRKVYAMAIDDEDDVREFDSASEAARKIPAVYSGSAIGRACRTSGYTAGGFYWSYHPFD